MSESKTESSVSVVTVRILVVLMLPLLVLTLGVNIEHLLLGWIYFPLQTIPQMTADWPSVIVGLLAMLFFVFGLHRAGRWLFHRATSLSSDDDHCWTLRSTIVCAALLLVLFASGTAMVGVTHQVVWLFSGRVASKALPNHYPGVVEQARDAARRSQVRNELKMLGLAFHNFHSAYGAFPPGGTVNRNGELLQGWAMCLGQYASYMAPDETDFSRGWKDPCNAGVYKCQLSCFVNPSQPGDVFDEDGYGLCHWAGNVHVLPVRTVDVDSSVTGVNRTPTGMSIKQITDGTSNTILLGTVGQNFRPWGHPANLRDPSLGVNRSPSGFGGPPLWQGGQFVMCDGSVRFLSNTTDLTVMKGLATPAGGEFAVGSRRNVHLLSN